MQMTQTHATVQGSCVANGLGLERGVEDVVKLQTPAVSAVASGPDNEHRHDDREQCHAKHRPPHKDLARGLCAPIPFMARV